MSNTIHIDGAWRSAISGATRDIRCPANGELVGTVSEADDRDTLGAIDAARVAFDSGVWSSVPGTERGELLLRAASELERRSEEFARAESLDTGKRLIESQIDIDDVVSCFRYYGKLAAQDQGRIVDAGDPEIMSRIVAEPVGVCALITPWNYPLLQASWKIAPALAAGNSFVLKPAELTPHTAVLLMHVLADVSLPTGVANLVTGSGAGCGTPLSTHSALDMVSFTGGLKTGRLIAANAAATVKKLALELGGKNPNIVFADADIDAALDNALNAA